MALTATPSDLEEILALWGIERPLLTPSSWGINNTSWFVESGAGHHVLRLYNTWSRKEVVGALPTLALHHEAVTLVWWLGRLRATDDVRPLADLAARAIGLERWLGAHCDKVMREARELLQRT